jgi:GT2 family glycosyltransferase
VDLSIIIVNWNTQEHLRACLASLRASALGSGLSREILVVDNASSDGSAAMVRAEFPEVALIANAENRGYAAGNNQGLTAASGEFLLLLNPDTEVPPGGLEALVAFLREHPRAGAAAPRLVHPDGQIQESVRGFPTPGSLLEEFGGSRLSPVARRLDALLAAPEGSVTPHDGEGAAGPYRVSVAGVTEPLSVDQPMASCFLIRREALAQVGGMDEQFPIFFNDVDLCYRIRRAGWGIWYLPHVRVLHHGGAATRQVRPEMIRESHRSLHRFYAKHYRRRLPAPVYAGIIGAIHMAGAVRYWRARLPQLTIM